MQKNNCRCEKECRSPIRWSKINNSLIFVSFPYPSHKIIKIDANSKNRYKLIMYICKFQKTVGLIWYLIILLMDVY